MSVETHTNNSTVTAVPPVHSVPEDTSACVSPGKTARLTLRNGVWYADDVRVNDYQKALKLTLQTAAIAAQPKLPKATRKPRKPRPPEPPEPDPVPEALEARAWWPEFVRDHLERKARKAAADRYDALFKKRRDWEARRQPLWVAQAPNDTRTPTLRERALATLANSREVRSVSFDNSGTRWKAVSA